MYTQALFGVKLFDYEEVSPDEDGYQFGIIKAHLPSLKKFDGEYFSINLEWIVEVWSVQGELLDKFCIYDLLDFREQLKL